MLFRNSNTIKFVLGVIALFGIMYAWWLTLVASIILSVRYRAWEVPVFGLLLDFAWYAPDLSFHWPICTAISILIVWVFEPLRNRLFTRS